MNKTEEIGTTIQRLSVVRKLIAMTEELRPRATLSVRGVSGSLDACLVSAIAGATGRQIAFVARDRASAVRMGDDLAVLLDPGWTYHFGAGREREMARRVEDVEGLQALIKGSARIILTHPDALCLRLPAPTGLRNLLLSVKSGMTQRMDDLIDFLDTNGFVRKDFIETIGDYSVRGGIIDVFPFVGDNPVRIEFNGDVVGSLREFEPLSQRSIKELSAANITPDLLKESDSDPNNGSLFSYLHAEALVVLDEPSFHEEPHPGDSDEWSTSQIDEFLSGHQRLIFSNHRTDAEGEIDFRSTPQPAFNGSIRFFGEHAHKLLAAGYDVTVGCDGHAEMKRLKDLLEESAISSSQTTATELLRPKLVHRTLHEGFELPSGQLAFFTEHQIFARRKRIGRRQVSSRKKGLSQNEIQRLRKEDHVVHSDYGIGKFDGLKTMSVRGVQQDVLKIVYEGGDVLYVNLDYVNRVQKYSSKEGHIPKLTRLGSPEWQKLKARAKGRIKDIARDLIRLYSERKSTAGFAYQPDTPWQKELEASFIFEDTFDQARATMEVKADMESPFPMDRLICGDVGFGKTEVAVRAAFKAVLDAKQVAVLVPTTILAIQHFNTFSDRLSKYSVRVEVISRLKSRAEQTAILEKLMNGMVDVLIGTHRLLSKDVVFKDLGLLVVDEEHRFGVSAKEKLRQKKAVVDTLTLTATPIPRTLHFSLMGARDLSVIATPPRNRLPIITEIVEFNEQQIRDALLREIHRGGQVYVVHDRVQDIGDFAVRLAGMVPGVRIAFAHGQMNPRELESVMIQFLERKLDVLVCTKIIESGLDIPNVNTILINRADRFGMAELYQLRGRVGRSNVQAFAFLIAPPLGSLPRESLRRLSAMREFTELGTGFNLAMRDLEIRGAGNLLGSEQSGYITDMGFETYTRILEEAVRELKDEEFQGMFETTRLPSTENTVVEVDVDALIPAAYVGSSDARLEVYKRLYGVTSREQVLEIGEELRDRFGPLPVEARNLLDVLLLRLAGSHLGCRKMKVKSDFLEIDVTPEPESWNDDQAGMFVSSVAIMRKPTVKVLDLKNGVKLRVSLDSTHGPLHGAHEALEAVTPVLKGIVMEVPSRATA